MTIACGVANYVADNSKDRKWSCFGEENHSLVATLSKMVHRRLSDSVILPEAMSDV